MIVDTGLDRMCNEVARGLGKSRDSNRVPPVFQTVAVLLEPTCSMDTAELGNFASLHLMTETSTASETLCLEKLKTVDNIRNSSHVYCTSTSETLGLRGELECRDSETRTPVSKGKRGGEA
jgi:hypothetical protein